MEIFYTKVALDISFLIFHEVLAAVGICLREIFRVGEKKDMKWVQLGRLKLWLVKRM